jgi:hypothetical protein
MLFFTLKTIIISLMLIALIHYLYGFFKDTLTIPKVKDLVNRPAKRYDEMFNLMNNKSIGQAEEQMHMQMQEQKHIQIMGQQSMQDELKNFLSELKKPDVIKKEMNTNFSAANELSSGAYSSY